MLSRDTTLDQWAYGRGVSLEFIRPGKPVDKRSQIQKYGGRVIATDLHNPDFVKLAECYGALGLRAETPEALASAIRRGFDHEGPTLIEIPVGDLPSPWQFIHMPRVRGSRGTEAKKM